MSELWVSNLSTAVEEILDGVFDSALNPACDGIVLWDQGGTLQAFTTSVATILGLPQGALSLGMKEQEIQELQGKFRNLRFLNGLRSDAVSGMLTVPKARSEFRVVLDTGRVVQIDSRSLTHGGVATVVADVSDTVLGSDVGDGETQVLHQIVEHCPVGAIVLCNDTNACLMANSALIDWLGRDFIETLAETPPAPVGDRMDDAIAILTDPQFSASMTEHEITWVAPDGNMQWILLSGRPLTFEGRQVRIIWFRDISTRRRQALDLQSKVTEKTRQLEEALHRADLASLAKTQFLANMSHELRTPLNSIIGFSDLLQKEMFGPIGSERYAEFVTHIHSAGAHLLELINDILDVSRIELGEMGLKEDLFDLVRSVAATIAMIRPKLVEKGHQFTADLPDVPVGFQGDERQIRQILMNLLTNAVKFTEPNGSIALTLTVDRENGVALTVEDNGIGIREVDLDRVLNPFEQATDETYSRSIEGAGLGLYLTQAIAKAHGGDLAIESAPGQGTAVTVTLPASRLRTLD